MAGALEVGVELAVGEVLAGGVCDVDGEGGLADAADTGERGDRHHAALGGGELFAEFGDEGRPAGEVGDRGGELLGPHDDLSAAAGPSSTTGGASSSVSARRMRCWSSESEAQGSTPSSSASSRRVSA